MLDLQNFSRERISQRLSFSRVAIQQKGLFLTTESLHLFHFELKNHQIEESMLKKIINTKTGGN